MARRCFCPPDNFLGYSSALLSSPTFLSRRIPIFVASSFDTPFSRVGVMVIFSNTVRCGNTLKCWKTMPIFCRCLSIFRFFAAISTPSKITWPLVGSSSKFKQRRKVLFPEPDGPMIDTTSPL